MSYIAICGPGESATSEQTLLAYQVGEILAVNGHTVLTGGLNGVMAAAAAGCRTAGGTSLGFLPGDDRESGSPTHSLLIPTGLGEMRNALLVRSADAVVVVGNSFGTLSEAVLALRTDKPLIVLTGSELPLQVPEIELDDLINTIEAVI